MLLASMSPKSWHLDATLPPDPGGTRELVIEGTHRPFLQTSGDGLILIQEPASWPGRATYLVPAGTKVERVSISERCTKACSACPVPDTAKVAVTRFETVRTWRIEVRGEPQETRLEKASIVTGRVGFTATSPVIGRVETSGPLAEIETRGDEVFVHWWDAKPGVVRWTPILAIEGKCDEDAPCAPPPTAKLEITRITVERTPAP